MKETALILAGIIVAITLAVVIIVNVMPKTQGSATTSADTVIFWHDDSRGVGCWIYGSGYRGGLSCLPDGQYRAEAP